MSIHYPEDVNTHIPTSTNPVKEWEQKSWAMYNITRDIKNLTASIDKYILCDLIGSKGSACTELLSLKAEAMNLLIEVEAFCDKADRIATTLAH